MSGQHRDGLPEDCGSCRKLFAVLDHHHQESPDVRLTTPTLGELSGLARRAVQVHTAHLRMHGRLEADLRTPVDGAEVEQGGEIPADATPRDWLASVRVNCRTCQAILRELVACANGRWRGSISMADLAGRVGVSEHATRMHTRTGHQARNRIGHSLVSAGLVAFLPDGEITGKNRHGQAQYIRRPDRFVLWPSAAPAEPVVRGDDWHGDMAAELVNRLAWVDPTHPEASWIVRLVAACLADGWAEAEIEKRLNVAPRTDAPLRRPYLFARRRLQDAPPPRPTPEVVAAVERTGPTVCRWCKDPIGPNTPPERHAGCEEEWSSPVGQVIELPARAPQLADYGLAGPGWPSAVGDPDF